MNRVEYEGQIRKLGRETLPDKYLYEAGVNEFLPEPDNKYCQITRERIDTLEARFGAYWQRVNQTGRVAYKSVNRDGIELTEVVNLVDGKPLEMVRCDCGHVIPAGVVMNTSTGTSCPDCYDRRSK